MLVYGALVLAGAATRWGYFNRGEHHMYGTRYMQFGLVLAATVVVTVKNVMGQSTSQALITTFTLSSGYLGGLYLSLVIYRIFFSPLKDFPGPFGAKISSLWLTSQLSKGDFHKKILALHREYGDFVRIGSSDLSIIHPKAVIAIYGPLSECTKSDFYDITLPMISMHTTRSQAEHDRRCRVWSTAFSEKALRGYEERIKTHQDLLVAQITAASNSLINTKNWLSLYAFDVMGDLAFGASFDMLQASKEHWAITLLGEGLEPLSAMFPPWAFRILTAIPIASRGWWRFIYYCCQRLEDRMNVKKCREPAVCADSDIDACVDRNRRSGYYVNSTQTLARRETLRVRFTDVTRGQSAYSGCWEVLLFLLLALFNGSSRIQ